MRPHGKTLRAWFAAVAIIAGVGLACVGTSIGKADEPAKSKDDALEELLKKVEDKARPEAKAEKPAPAAKPAPAKPKADAKPAPAKPKAAPEDLSTKDKDLDSLLEKL